MSSESKSPLNSVIYEQAAEWLIELREGQVDDAVRERLDAWFRESPQHIRAYLELAAIWEDSADSQLDRAHTTDELIARARATSNVIALHASANGGVATRVAADTPPVAIDMVTAAEVAPQPRRSTERTSFVWRRNIAVAAVLACVTVGTGLYFYQQRNLTFATQTGEQRFVSLIDGSTLELNSRSRARIRFSDHQRDVDLLEGQALFHVAKDATRPFVVHSGSTQVRAVGTQFDVYQKDSGTVVTVVEGRVSVLSPFLRPETETGAATSAGNEPAVPATSVSQNRNSRAGRVQVLQGARGSSVPARGQLSEDHDTVLLDAGQQITVGAPGSTEVVHTDTVAAIAWTKHQLVFDSTPLDEVAHEFNRYNTRQLVMVDSALSKIHISGVFSSVDAASLLRFLRTQRDIAVEETGEDIRIVKK